MHGTRHLSSAKEYIKRAVSPGRMSESPGKNYERWERDDTSYLLYYDGGTVKRKDMFILANDHEWLEDRTINFWIEYLKNEELAKFPKASIEFLYTALVPLLKNESLEVAKSCFVDPKYLEDRITHIFVPVNDDSRKDHDTDEYKKGRLNGGTHWSLLVVSLIDNVAFHYDSLGGYNHEHAELVARKLGQALPRPRKLRFVPMGSDAPQQSDGSNCGIFVCVFMKHLLVRRLLRADANEKVTMSMRGQDVDFVGARKMLRDVIEERREYAIKNNMFNDDKIPKIE